MIRIQRRLAGSLAALCLCGFAVAEPAALTKEEVAGSAKTDALSIPTPGELMAAMNKQGKIDWTSRFRAPIATNYISRAQGALNLGGLIADGYIAVEAQDAQQVKNIGRDILSIGKPLGVSKDILNRGSSISEFAEKNQWEALKEELEATQNEVKTAMVNSKDQDLVSLVTVGGWVRGIEVISGYVAQHYSEAGAKLLRQPAVIGFLNKRLDALPDKVREEGPVLATRKKLIEMEMLASMPREKTPSEAEVKQLSALASELVKTISRKDGK